MDWLKKQKWKMFALFSGSRRISKCLFQRASHKKSQLIPVVASGPSSTGPPGTERGPHVTSWPRWSLVPAAGHCHRAEVTSQAGAGAAWLRLWRPCFHCTHSVSGPAVSTEQGRLGGTAQDCGRPGGERGRPGLRQSDGPGKGRPRPGSHGCMAQSAAQSATTLVSLRQSLRPRSATWSRVIQTSDEGMGTGVSGRILSEFCLTTATFLTESNKNAISKKMFVSHFKPIQ